MLDAGLQLLLFAGKAMIVVILILALLAGILALLSKGKERSIGKITIKNLTKKYEELSQELFAQMLNKKQFKKFSKEQKNKEKLNDKKENANQKNLFVLHFNGDVKATAVTGLREEITALLQVATPKDEVLVCVESAGGMVHAYGLAAAQLQRVRDRNIPLTVSVDKVAASGGYLMACVANKILAAPFAIIGSIGVVVQLPNFHRYLKEKHIDFEMLTAGNFKRTLTLFGQNTEEGREKLQEEIEHIHSRFKEVIREYRPVDIEKVATGEHWLASQALDLKLIDELMTSDDYLMEKSKDSQIFELSYHAKKSLANKLFASASLVKTHLFGSTL